MRRGNVVVIGIAADYRLACSHADCGAVARLWPLLRVVVNLLQHRVINVRSESILNGAQICAMTVSRQLHAMREAFREVVHEAIRTAGVAIANEPARNELRIGIERNPSPNIARALLLHFNGAVLLLRSDERPDSIALHAPRF